MNKRLVFSFFIFATLLSHAFAQTSLISSAKDMATVGEFSDDADNVVANYIGDIDNSFFSLVYQQGDSVGIFGAVALGDHLTFGLAGEYSFSSLKTESYDVGTSTITTGKVFDESSSFNIRPVFKYYNMGFHYRIFRGGSDSTTFSEVSSISSGDITDYSRVITDGAQWEHEVAFYYDNSMLNVYVPVGIIINENDSTTRSTNISGTTTTEVFSEGRTTGYNDSDVGTIKLYLNPKFVKTLEAGPLYQVAVGLNSSIDVYNTGSAYSSTTTVIDSDTSTTTMTKIVAKSEDQFEFGADLYVNPSLAWTISDKKIDLALDVTAGIKYEYSNSGLVTTTTTVTDTDPVIDDPSSESYTNTISPYLDIAFGSLIRPFSWLELRTGVACGFEWANEINTLEYYSVSDDKVHTVDYALLSSFDIAAGVGITIVEGFVIDAYIQVGQSVTLEDDFSTTTSSFGISSWGAQMSYKF